MSLERKIFGGVVWTAFDLLINKGLGFVIKLFLARLLFPSDYGIIGMAVVFIAFARVLSESGIGPALVQIDKSRLNKSHLDTTFWFSVIWAIAIYIVMALVVTPLAATFYAEPMLSRVIPILSLSVLISPLNTVHRSQLNRAFQFKKIALINNTASIVSGVAALVLAYTGFGVWTLVWYNVLPLIIMLPQLWKATGYRPGAAITKEAFQDIFNFGVVTTGTAIVVTFINQLDYLLVGKMVSKYALGLYTFAFLLTDVVRRQIVTVLNSVMFPAYSVVQDDVDKLHQLYIRVVKVSVMAIYLPMTVLFVNTAPLIGLFFGEKWLGATTAVQLMVLAVMSNSITSSHGALLRGMGQVGIEFKLQLFRAFILFAPALYFGIKFYGIEGAAAAVALQQLLGLPFVLYFLNKVVGISPGIMFKNLYPDVLSAVTAIAVGFIVREYLPATIPGLIGTILAMTLSFGGAMYLIMGKDLFKLYHALTGIIKSKKDNRKFPTKVLE